MRALLLRLVRFGAVGVVAFLVDSGSLWLGRHFLGLGLYSGRLLSFLCAASVAWYLNRRFTFADRGGGSDRHRHRQWVLYLAASLAGAGANVGTYAILVGAVPQVAAWPTLGVAAGSVAGMLVNFVAYSRIVFRHGPVARPPTA